MGVDVTLHHFMMECPAHRCTKEECLEGFKSIFGASKFNEVISGDDRGNGFPIESKV